MCGICCFIGYIPGYKKTFDGLLRLENRGYDSCGMSSILDNKIVLSKFATLDQSNTGFDRLQNHVEDHKEAFNIISHTRWATHGPKTDNNSHPHLDHTGKFSLVHNGIIENYSAIKKQLLEKHNIKFQSQTDTEVIVNLISVMYDKYKNVDDAIKNALDKLEGTWGLVLQFVEEPNKLYCARHGSPLLVGFSEEYFMISSEQSGFSQFVENYICMNNKDIIVLEKKDNKIVLETLKDYEIKQVNIDNNDLTPEPYPHWTLKEIYEQYDSLIRATGMGGRILNDREVKLGGLYLHQEELKDIDNLILLGCGSSYHAGLFCLKTLKEISGFNTVQIFDGADFTKYDIPKKGKTGLILLSQSGETKDLHRCIEIGKDHNLFMIGVVNVVDSMIAREVHCGVYLNAGREVGVASTKAFSSQIIVLTLISVYFSQIRNINEFKRKTLIEEIRRLPIDVKNTIDMTLEQSQKVASYLLDKQHLFVLGRDNCESSSKEGALKIKEIGYLHAEGYNSSALKHGSYAILEKDFPVIMLIPDDHNFKRNSGIVEELKSRYAFVIGISDCNLDDNYNIKIKIPKNSTFSGLLSVVVMQLIAYNLSTGKGVNPDKPKNLAKVVTVD